MSGGMEAFAALMMMGVRVREVCGLIEGNVWVPDRSLLLIDRDLPVDDRALVADELIQTVAAMPALESP